jgi:hypothetical protein
MAKKRKSAWTVMVYLAGDNNLTTECMFAISEMKKAVLTDGLNVIAQFDPCDPYLPTHRYEINKNKQSEAFYSDIIDCARYCDDRGEVSFTKESAKATSLAQARKKAQKSTQAALQRSCLTQAIPAGNVSTDDTDTGSTITLYNFLSFCIEEYPAEHYMVVLSGHAGGTERDFLLKDESTARSLTFNELKRVFQQVKTDRRGELIDIIGMDNCLMSMAEICYELRDEVEIVVGSESFSPSSGWPYCQILERLSKDFIRTGSEKAPPLNAEVAKAIVEEFVNYYSIYWMAGLSVTQSALDVKKVKRLHEIVDALGAAMEHELVNETCNRSPKERFFENALLLAHWEAQSYNGEQFVDLYDFCDCLENRWAYGEVVDRCRAVKKFIESELVLKSCYCGATYQYSYGVSMYFPWARIAPSYWNLDFVSNTKDAGWGSFLKTYTHLTRRLPRGVNGPKTLTAMATGAMPSSIGATEHRIIDDRMILDRSGLSLNRVHSMRNPPNTFVPDECIRNKQNAIECQKILLRST